MDSSQYEWIDILDNNTYALGSRQSLYSCFSLYVDIAQISLQDLPYYQQYGYGVSQTVKYRLRDGGRTEYPSAKHAFDNAVVLADDFYDWRSGYDTDEFRVYTNQENNAWIVIAWLFIAVFSMETGELVFCVGTEGTGFEYDYSQRSEAS